MYWTLLGNTRICLDCGLTERACLGGYGDRRDRIAAYLTARLAR